MRQVYGARWQIELLFKLWKSEGALAQVRGQQSGRVLCELYAKLIGLAVFGYLSAPVRWATTELSPVKAWQVWQRQIERVAQALRSGAGLAALLVQLYQRWQQFGGKEHRADRPSSYQALQQQPVPNPFARLTVRSTRSVAA